MDWISLMQVPISEGEENVSRKDGMQESLHRLTIDPGEKLPNSATPDTCQ